jgi:hypothetical protein
MCLVVLANKTNAQITILASDFPGKGDTVRYSSVPALANYAVTGQNFLWDFSDLVPQSQLLMKHLSVDSADALTQSLFGSFVIPKYRATYYLPARELPLAALSGFLDLPVEEIYRFYRKTNEEMTVVGLSISAMGFGVGKRADSIEVAYKYPMTYGQSYQSEGLVDLDLSALAPFALKQYRTRSSEVDGWGTIKTPYGSFSCLRIHHVINELDSIYIDFGTGPTWFPINIPVIHEYEWWAKDQKGPIMKVVANQVFGIQIPTQIIYRDIFRLDLNVSLDEQYLTGISLYPNPTNNFLYINGAVQNSKIEIYSMSGKLLYQTDYTLQPIDVRSLDSGAYFVQIIDGSTVQTIKFVKQ